MFEGSGWFSWFLSRNPLLDRDFDRWSVGNEDFYREFSFAIYSKDENLVKSVIKKYQVSYLLLDESIINAGGTPETLYIPETKELLEKVGIYKTFEDGFLSVYKTGVVGNQVASPTGYSEIGSVTNYGQIDPLYINFGNYVQTKGTTKYPFLNFDKRGNVEISEKENKLFFENPVEEATLSFPTDTKISEDFSLKRGYAVGYNCDLLKEGKVQKDWEENSVRYYADGGGVSCDFFDYSNLDYATTYVLRVRGENKAGRGLKIYLYNFAEKRMNLEELLPEGNFDEYFVIYPKQNEGEGGYSLNIETRSFGSIPSENILKEISLYPFDLQTVNSVYQGNIIPNRVTNNLQIEETKDLGNKYLVKTKGSGLFVLNQGFESGWEAYNIGCQLSTIVCKIKQVLPWFFFEKLEHLKVNSWSNGWVVPADPRQIVLPASKEILIVFWPQYLEWGGFLLIPISLSLILFLGKKVTKKGFSKVI